MKTQEAKSTVFFRAIVPYGSCSSYIGKILKCYLWMEAQRSSAPGATESQYASQASLVSLFQCRFPCPLLKIPSLHVSLETRDSPLWTQTQMSWTPLVLKLNGEHHFSEVIVLCKDEETEVQTMEAIL